MSELAKSVQQKGNQGARAQTSSLAKFHVMFQMDELTKQPWGDVFRGHYTLSAIMEILDGFEKNGVHLRVWFLEDAISEKTRKDIKAAFGGLGRDHWDHWFPAFQICPMMFAATQGLDRSVATLMEAEHFKPDLDQIVNGHNALGVALSGGWRPDIAIRLARAKPSAETLENALSVVEKHRKDYPDHEDYHQGECRDAVANILKKEATMLLTSNG